MTIAITGATGFVGKALLDRALALGHDVKALTRRKQPARKGVEWIQGDLSDKQALKALARDSDSLIHVAGVVSAPDQKGFEDGNVTGTLQTVEAAVAAGVKRLVNVSSLAARQPGLSLYGASKARAEKIVAASGLDWTTVRPPWVFGPGDKDTLDMFKSAKWGVVPMPADGRVSMIHVDDLSRLLLDLRESSEDVTHMIFEPDDGRADGWTHRELARAIGWAMGRRVWIPQLSRDALMRLSKIEKALRGKKAKLTEDRVNYMSHPDWVCAPRKHVPHSVWKPEVLTREGLKDTAEWYRAQGWL